MTQEELTKVFKYIVKKCDMLINNGNYEADAYTQDTVEDIAELCNHILDGDYGKLVEVKEVQKEPVSEDLEEEIQKTIHNHFFDLNGISIAGTSTYATVDDMVYIAKHFANWQKEQFEKNRLAACDNQTEEEAEIESDFVMNIIKNEHRQPTFDDAIKYGMRLQEEQMMAKAIDGEVGYWNLHGLSVNVDLPSSVEEGDKVKVIVIKEE